MDREQEQLERRLKAEAFDRILETYLRLQENANFYSKNWVELAEVIEAERRHVGRSRKR